MLLEFHLETLAAECYLTKENSDGNRNPTPEQDDR